MKKYLSMLAMVALAASAFAQGTVNFANNAATAIKNSDGVAIPANGGFVELLWAPAGTAATAYNPASQSLTQWLTANPGWAALETSIKPFIAPGRFIGGTVTVPTATPGAAIQAAVASWVGNYANFDAAFAANSTQGGVTAPFAVTTGNPTTTPPGVPAVITGAGQFGGMTTTAIGSIPEPTTLTLAGLGAAALLIFRRRQ